MCEAQSVVLLSVGLFCESENNVCDCAEEFLCV